MTSSAKFDVGENDNLDENDGQKFEGERRSRAKVVRAVGTN